MRKFKTYFESAETPLKAAYEKVKAEHAAAETEWAKADGRRDLKACKMWEKKVEDLLIKRKQAFNAYMSSDE